MNQSFWRNRKVFLSGHTGFKGSWLSIWLQLLCADVYGFALEPPTKPNLYRIANVGAAMKSTVGDIRDPKHLAESMRAAQPEIAIHMAAQAIVRHGIAHPIETYATNVMGTVHFLEAVLRTPSIKAAIIVTSDKCYDNKGWVWGYRESESLGGHDPYSSSKGCAELVVDAYRSTYFNPERIEAHGVALASVRAGNVIGGGDWAADRLVPDILRSIEAHEPVQIRNPHATRPWQHVLVPLSGYMELAEKLYAHGAAFGGAWNFGPDEDDAKPVAWIVDRITKLWGDGASWQQDNRDHPREDTYLRLDCSKAKARLGWMPAVDLETALRWIVEFNRTYLQKEDVRAVVESQIARFQNLQAQVAGDVVSQDFTDASNDPNSPPPAIAEPV